MLSRINGLKTIMLWKSMASSKLCSASLWTHAVYAIENRWAHELMHWKVDRLKQISIEKYLDSRKFCSWNRWTYEFMHWKLMDLCKSCIGKYIQANFALEMDGLMNLCIGKLIDYRRFYAFGHYGHFIQWTLGI